MKKKSGAGAGAGAGAEKKFAGSPALFFSVDFISQSPLFVCIAYDTITFNIAKKFTLYSA